MEIFPQNFERPKNREDHSDFDDFCSELIALTWAIISKIRKSIAKLPKIAWGDSGGARVLAACSHAFSLEVASLALTYKFWEAPEALRAHFFAQLGAPGPNFGPL